MRLHSVALILLVSAYRVVADVVYVPAFEKYPGYAGNLRVVGSVTIVGTSGTNTTAKQKLTWSLAGVDTACEASAGENVTNGCGVHVHVGTSCATDADVGGHYYSDALSTDPWAASVYVASADGNSNEHGGVEIVTGLSNSDIRGRVIVVHALEDGARIACGVISTETGAGNRVYVESFAPYPGYTGEHKVAGSMTIVGSSGSDTTAKQTLTWSLSGLDRACRPKSGDHVANGCGIHVHAGTSCDSDTEVGGHYYSASLSADPWAPVVYVASAEGTSDEHQGVQVVTGLSNGDITGRVMVVHALASGERIACGIIGRTTGRGAPAYVSSFLPYPDYTGDYRVVGTAMIVGTSGTDTTAKQTFTWSLTGADPACTSKVGDVAANGCGIHVHSGTSCDSPAESGEHFYSDALGADPWTPVAYVASPGGISIEEAGVRVTTGLSNGDLIGRVVVVHELASGARIACGIIGRSAQLELKRTGDFLGAAMRFGSVLPGFAIAFGVSLLALSR